MKISTHTLTWSVTCEAVKPSSEPDFNSHAHVERDRAVICINIGWQNFNSHAHVERDVGKEIIDKEQAISTHTLTWSVTLRASQQPCRT